MVTIKKFLTDENNRNCFVNKIEESIKKDLGCKNSNPFSVKTLDVKPTKTNITLIANFDFFLNNIEIEVGNDEEFNSEEALFNNVIEKLNKIILKDKMFSIFEEISSKIKLDYRKKVFYLDDKGICCLVGTNNKRAVIFNSSNYRDKQKEMMIETKKTFETLDIKLDIASYVVFNARFETKIKMDEFVHFKNEVESHILKKEKISFELFKNFMKIYSENSRELLTLKNKKVLYSLFEDLVNTETLSKESLNLKKIRSLKKIFESCKKDGISDFTAQMVAKNLDSFSNQFIIERNDLKKYSNAILSNINSVAVPKVENHFKKVSEYNKSLFNKLDDSLKNVFNKFEMNCFVSYIDFVTNKILIKYAKKNSLNFYAAEISLSDYKNDLRVVLQQLSAKTA